MEVALVPDRIAAFSYEVIIVSSKSNLFELSISTSGYGNRFDL